MLHALSVPVFARYLAQLDGLVVLAERHARANGLADAAVLQARLAPDMLPFGPQVTTAAYLALRACCPLAGRPVPPFDALFGTTPDTLDGLRQRLAAVQQHLQALPADGFAGAEARVVHERAGQADIALPGAEFLQQFALPNFFFHLVTAYNLLRGLGVPLGKADFDGLHAYPPVR